MGIDILSYVLGKSTGGGGGGKTLQNSGWVKSYDAYAEIDGNVVTLKSGSTTHDLRVAPPSSVRGSARFEPGDVFVIAFTVKEVSGRAALNMANASYWTAESATDLMTVSNGNTYTKETGNDVITFTFSATSGNSSQLDFHPSRASDGSSYANASAVIEVTGMKFNGAIIFGTV